MIARLAALRSRLRSQAGETLIETLSAVLLGTFAVTLLFGATTAAAHMNKAADAKTAMLQADQVFVETQQGNGEAETGQVRISDGGTSLGAYDVEVYTGPNGFYRAYSATHHDIVPLPTPEVPGADDGAGDPVMPVVPVPQPGSGSSSSSSSSGSLVVGPDGQEYEEVDSDDFPSPINTGGDDAPRPPAPPNIVTEEGEV